jgi:hypothetical protein
MGVRREGWVGTQAGVCEGEGEREEEAAAGYAASRGIGKAMGGYSSSRLMQPRGRGAKSISKLMHSKGEGH